MYLEVYSRRWGHNEKYTVNKTNNGWEISNIEIGGHCNKSGAPYLFDNLKHDSINYPESLGDYMEWLWDQATAQGMINEQIQSELDRLGNWIQTTERASPGGIFEPFK